MLDSISSQDNALQAAMGNIRADTNGLRSDFEAASSHLIEVDPYRRSSNTDQRRQPGAKVSAVTFAGWGKTGVDLRWHTRSEFWNLTEEQRDKLTEWQGTDAGKTAVKKQRAAQQKKRAAEEGDGSKGSWKKKFKKALSTKKGLSHVMSTLMEVEHESAPLVAALQPTLLPPPTGNAPTAPTATVAAAAPVPAADNLNSATVAQLSSIFPALSTKVKLNLIMRNN